MADREKTIRVVREWIAKAENDLTNAAHTLKLGKKCPTDTVCFHAQQCAEKYIKALLVMEGIDFSKTHDLEKLVAVLPSHLNLDIAPEEMAGLTSYATVGRYPGWEDITLWEARRAVTMGRRIRKRVRAILPKAVFKKENPGLPERKA